MNNYYGSSWEENNTRQKQVFVESGLANAFMKQVFVIMAFGLAISGLSAWFMGNKLLSGEWLHLFMGPMRYVIMFAPLAFVLVLSFGIQKMSYTTASIVFGLYSLVMGLSLAPIFLVYTQASVFKTFFVAAASFGIMAFVGAVTKTDLTKFGSILMMALFGLIIAGLVNMFLRSSMMDFVISGFGVLIFCGLTAYDTQKLIAIGATADTENEGVRKVALMGALSLYLDFINLFLYLLRFLGNRRD